MREVVTEKAPKPIGHYSQAIQSGPVLFLSGQIPIDPKTNEISLFNGDVAKQTELVLKNIQAILEAENLSWKNVVRTAIFLRNLSEFPKVNEIYAKVLGAHKPARVTVEVSNLPKGAAIEIEVIAHY